MAATEETPVGRQRRGVRSRQHIVLGGVYQRFLGDGIAAPEEEDDTRTLLAEGLDGGIGELLPAVLLVAACLMGTNGEGGVEQQHPLVGPAAHTVNLLTTYALGDQREWELSARWTFGSGFPYTQTQGIFERLLFPSGIVSNYTRENGEYSLHYADLYKGRLPNYHRLDLGVKRKISLGTRSILELSLSATNV